MKKYLSGGTCAAIAGAAMLLSFAGTPAQAQVPGGSYLQSCRDVRAHGDRLTAVCRRAGGGWARTTLRDVDRCIGGIANSNGRLTCNMGHQFGSSRPPHWEHDRWDRGYGSSYDPRHNLGDRDWYGR